MNSIGYKDLIASLQYLDRVCDGANSEDGSGFNGLDTSFGKSLARQSLEKVLSDKQQRAAIKLLQKYRKQLEAVGINLPTQEDYLQHLTEVMTDTKKANRIEILKASLDVNDFGKECIALTFLPDAFDRPTLALIKEIPGRFYKKEKTAWWIPPEQWETALQKIGTQRFSISSELESKYGLGSVEYRSENIPQSPTDLANIKLDGIDVPGLKGTPFQFQREGIEFLDLADGSAILADDMGLGKTLQALGYIQLHPKKRPVLIVCPASIKLNWYNEIDKWMTINKETHIINGRTNYRLPKVDIYIINYDILEAWADTIKNMGVELVVFDEAHAMKNITAKRTKAAMDVGINTPYKILMTGTPILNRPVELYPLLKTVQPDKWGTFSAFTNRYCAAHRRSTVTPRGQYRSWMDYTGASNIDELSGLLKNIVLRRLKKDVLKDLPDKTRTVVPIEINKRKYDTFVIQTTNEIEKRNLRGGDALVLIEKLKQYVAEQKLQASMEWIESSIESEKLVLFCTHRDIADQIIKKFSDKCVYIHGGVSKDDRQKAVDRFQTDDDVRLFVGTIQSCGEGITLTAASNVAILELLWNPGRHRQAEDRVHRIGQKDAVNVWYLLADKTIDTYIFDQMHGKQSIINQVLDEDNIESSFDQNELVSMTLEYLKEYIGE